MSKSQPILTILIPVYNEKKTIKTILQKTTVLPIESYEVIIVDDASKDGSGAIIEKFANGFKSKNVSLSVISHEQNRGKGAGIQTALQKARGKYFIIQDADLEYDPADIPKVLEEATNNKYDAVYGSRFLGDMQGMPRANYFANKGYNIILRLLYRTSVTDMHTCYKLVRTGLLKKIKVNSNGFDYATEIVSKLLRRGIQIHEVPISFSGRTKQEGKKIDMMDGIDCAYKLIRYRFSSIDKIADPRSEIFGRFLIVGGLGFFSNYFSLVFMTSVLSINHIIAETLAALIALQITFLLHDQWTYTIGSKDSVRKLGLLARYFSYFTSNAFGSFMTVVGFGVLYNYLPRLLSLLIAAVLGLVWNYLMNTYIIWSRKQT